MTKKLTKWIMIGGIGIVSGTMTTALIMNIEKGSSEGKNLITNKGYASASTQTQMEDPSFSMSDYKNPMKTFSTASTGKFLNTDTSKVRSYLNKGNEINFKQSFTFNLDLDLKMLFGHTDSISSLLFSKVNFQFCKGNTVVKTVTGGDPTSPTLGTLRYRTGFSIGFNSGLGRYVRRDKINVKVQANLKDLELKDWDNIKIDSAGMIGYFRRWDNYFGGLNATNIKITGADGSILIDNSSCKTDAKRIPPNTGSIGSKWYGTVQYGFSKPFYQTGRLVQSTYKDVPNVAKMLFSPLADSTTQKDLDNGEAYWTDMNNPPKFHLGLNNNLFDAYDNMKDRDTIKASVTVDSTLSSKQRSVMTGLINDYKIDSKNVKTVMAKVKRNEDVSSLPVLKWSKYITNKKYIFKDGTKDGTNVIDWMRDETNNLSNYEILAEYIKTSKFKLEYMNDGVARVKDNISPSNMKDYSIALINTNNKVFNPL